MDKVAILVDGGFYQRRANHLFGNKQTGEERASELHKYCLKHLAVHRGEKTIHDELYRIFYYDCPPCSKKVYHPFLKRQIDLGKTDLFSFMTAFHTAIKGKRKTALRMGELDESNIIYTLKPETVKAMLSGNREWGDLKETDFTLNVRQKGVDMRIGLDIASVAYKKQVTKIVLISGDSDFVPAAKLARREGIDFVLDPMGAPIANALSEHVDGIHSNTKVSRI